MSKIKTLYNEYIEKEYVSNQRMAEALDRVAEVLPKKEYDELEEAISSASDWETEEAFAAGFKTAIRLMREAMV